MLFIEHAASGSYQQQLGSVTAEDPVEFREVRPDFLATGLAVIGIERPETVCQKRINIYQRHLLTVLSLKPSIPRSTVNSSKPWSKPIKTSTWVK